MGDDGATGEDRRFDPIYPAELTFQTWRLAQMPLILCTAWWNGMVAFWLRASPCEGREGRSENAQDPDREGLNR